jgi:uncharacterized protein
MRFVTVPGIDGSGAEHWQSLWEPDLGAVRIRPASWSEPDEADWLRALDEALAESAPQPVVVIAHSLGCLLTATRLAAGPSSIAAALLVAPPDASGPTFPAAASSFRTPRVPLPVPTLVVASLDDPYASISASEAMADAWAARLVTIGAGGHINAASGLGSWPEGRQLLADLLATAGASG